MRQVIDRQLTRTTQLLQWALALTFTVKLLLALTLIMLLLGTGIVLGFVTARSLVHGILAVALVGGALVWFVGTFVIAGTVQDRIRASHALENAHPVLLDRLNTLAHLGESPRQQLVPFAYRMERQVAQLIGGSDLAVPGVFDSARRWGLAWLGLLVLTIGFYSWFHPFRRLQDRPRNEMAQQATNPPADLQIPEVTRETPGDSATAPWLEARVVEPGQDLVITELESVPLRIEAATNGTLANAQLHSSINGGPELPHQPLTPSSPQFLSHSELLKPAELGMKNWDLMSYYASASAHNGLQGSSAMYFIEVRPLRDELQSLQGGVDGEAYRALSELTGMVESQQDAVRATRDLSQVSPERSSAEARESLARSESALASETRSLRSNLPDDPRIDSVRDRLDQANQLLDTAAQQLRAMQTQEAAAKALEALGRLAEARKEIHRIATEHPDLLGPRPTPPLIATDLEELAAQRQAAEQTLDQLQQLAQRQERVADQVKPCDTNGHGPAAEEQRQIAKDLDELLRQPNQACQRAGEKSARAGSAADAAAKAVDALAQQHNNSTHSAAKSATQESAQAMRSLADALERQVEASRSAEADRLSQALDDQIEFLRRLEDQPDQFTPEQIEKAAQEMQELTTELQQLSEKPGFQKDAGQALREMLSGENKRRLDGL